MDLQKYLDRIGFKGEISVCLETLKKLQTSHQLNVPYENIDILLGVPLILKNEVLFEKIVNKHRGGWCHELNGLFCWALRELGFKVDIVSANFSPNGKEFSSDIGHLCLIVHLDEMMYFVDVGSAITMSPHQPMCLNSGSIMRQPNGLYKLTETDGYWLLSSQHLDEAEESNWKTFFRIRLTAYLMEDFQEICDVYLRGEGRFHYLLCENPLVMKRFQGNDEFGAHLILGKKYRYYSPLGYLKRKSLNVEEDISLEKFGQLLQLHFGIRMDNLKVLQWDKFGKEEKREMPQLDKFF